MNPFVLLFSPSGAVGRLGWWLGQLFIFILSLILVVLLLAPVEQATGTHSAQELVKKSQGWTQADRTGLAQKLQTELNNSTDKPLLGAIVVLGLLIFWCGLAVEVKRWHDLDMSGAWYLSVFVPGLSKYFADPGMAGIITLVIVLIRLYFLGCARAPGEVADGMKHRPQKRAKAQSSGSGFRVFFAVVFGIIVAGVLAVAAYFGLNAAVKSGKITIPANVTALLPTKLFPALKPAPPPVAVTPAPVIIPTRGTDSTDFAKDWVVVKNQKYTGITGVLPVAGDEVAIIYADGAKSIPASSLPQGFLDAWKITPDALKAVEKK